MFSSDFFRALFGLIPKVRDAADTVFLEVSSGKLADLLVIVQLFRAVCIPLSQTPHRALTTSFGSICFGSLLVALIQALKQLAHEARQNGDSGILACIAECILGCLESIGKSTKTGANLTKQEL